MIEKLRKEIRDLKIRKMEKVSSNIVDKKEKELNVIDRKENELNVIDISEKILNIIKSGAMKGHFYKNVLLNNNNFVERLKLDIMNYILSIRMKYKRASECKKLYIDIYNMGHIISYQDKYKSANMAYYINIYTGESIYYPLKYKNNIYFDILMQKKCENYAYF